LVSLVSLSLGGFGRKLTKAQGPEMPAFTSPFLVVIILQLAVILCLVAFGVARPKHAVDFVRNGNHTHTNILLILADDLGYGDLSVPQFSYSGIKTPNLEKMAAKGTVLTNYHTAAATCTPTRASILTGMYPWRLGLRAVYEYGEKYKSNRDDWLPQVPTSAMAFRDNNYFTGHSGKWHLGGMRNDDYDMRNLPLHGDPAKGLAPRKCPHPGPNQQGFEEYVSVLDGPGAPRQGSLQVNSRLYSEGCTILIQNDVHIGRLNGSSNELLSDCEARHAIRMMTAAVARNQPFYIHVWFHAPHGPWEYIPEFDFYNTPASQRGRRFNQYKTMVSSMDRAIGTLLTAVHDLGVEDNTLVVFTSDNGPEPDAGHTGFFREKKRFIYEGGIRVPCIMQWVNTIPAGAVSDSLVISTDLYPTFLHAANILPPETARLDGMSVLPELIPTARQHRQVAWRNMKRTTLWHNDYEGPRKTAIWVDDFKIFLNEHEDPHEMFDMRIDKFEKNNLIGHKLSGNHPWKRADFADFEKRMTSDDWKQIGVDGLLHADAGINVTEAQHDADGSSVESHEQQRSGRRLAHGLVGVNSIDFEKYRNSSTLHLLMVSRAFPYLLDYASHGDEAYQIYLSDNPERKYPETPESDQRNVGGSIYRYTSREQGQANRKLNMGKVCLEACSCAVPYARDIPTLPFNRTTKMMHSLMPGELPRVTTLLHVPTVGSTISHQQYQSHHRQHAHPEPQFNVVQPSGIQATPNNDQQPRPHEPHTLVHPGRLPANGITVQQQPQHRSPAQIHLPGQPLTHGHAHGHNAHSIHSNIHRGAVNPGSRVQHQQQLQRQPK
jgi:arylsulfatase A-like enzyme